MLDTAQTVLFKWLPPQLCAASNPIFVASWRQPPRGQFWAQGGSFDFVNGPMEVSPRLLQNPMYLETSKQIRSRNLGDLICRGMTKARILKSPLESYSMILQMGSCFGQPGDTVRPLCPARIRSEKCPEGSYCAAWETAAAFKSIEKKTLDEVKNVKK